MIGKLEIEAIRVFVGELRAARQMKAMLVETAKEYPQKLLETLKSLPGEDQKSLKWLERIAKKHLR